MAKKLVMLVVMLALAAPVAFAGRSSGCGLGAVALEGNSGLLMNLVATFLNGISGNQTFGITSGTSGCDASDTVYNDTLREEFVAVNFDNLSEEMAQGDGAYVAAMAELMGCDVNARSAFGEMSQAKYETLFSAPDMDAKTWLTGLEQEMAKDPVLSRSCTRIS